MDVFGIGPSEILLILVVALIFLGPRDLAKTGRTIGRFLRKLVMSDEWRAVQQAGKELRNMPNRLIREAGLEEMEKEIKEIDPRKQITSLKKDFDAVQKDLSAWTTTPPTIHTPETTKTPDTAKSSDQDEKPESSSDSNQP